MDAPDKPGAALAGRKCAAVQLLTSWAADMEKRGILANAASFQLGAAHAALCSDAEGCSEGQVRDTALAGEHIATRSGGTTKQMTGDGAGSCREKQRKGHLKGAGNKMARSGALKY